MTINRFCASGLQSIALAAERIRGGGAEVIVAGGAESMSFVPMGGNKVAVNPVAGLKIIPVPICTMGLTAERVAKHYGISREDADSSPSAVTRTRSPPSSDGKFEDEIVPVPVTITSPNGNDQPKTATTEVQRRRRAARRYHL